MTILQTISSSLPSRRRISRRTLLKGSAALAVGAAALPLAHGTAVEPSVAGTSSGTISKGKVIDCHAHLNHRSRSTWETDDRKLIEAADKLGIDQLCCSTLTPHWSATLDGFRECNRWTAEGMRRFPGRVLGYCYVNPGYGREALEEVRRYVGDQGFIGIKLYNEYTCTEPVVFPIVELAIELGVPILHHASHSHYFVDAATEQGMVISIPIRVEDNRERSWLLNVPDVPLEEIVELVKACSKARFILLNGIGYTRCPLGRKDNGLPSNYAIELSRLSAVLANELGQLITNLGAERVMFGTGMPFNYTDPALVKMEVLDASEADKEKIRSQNAMTWLRL